MKKLFIKYLKRECTEEEMQQIVSYFQNATDFSDVPTIEAVYQLLEKYPDMDEASANRINKKILETRKFQTTPIKKKRQFWKYTAAAILVIALASTYFLRDTLFNNQIENTAPIIVNNKIEPGIDKATLTLEDGSTVILEKGTTYQTQNANSNGEQIIYDPADNATDKLAYNYLTIPRGGQFQLTLSDGTKVWLNSETQLKFPVSFVDGESRQVELVYGEAYFEVSPSTAHNGATFKVFNKAQEIEVLGTEFNIKAYKDESNIYTTLVEGKVAVNFGHTSQNLLPNQQAVLNINTNKLKIAAVEVYNEIAWKEGIFSFDGKPLKDILKVLSRWYDMEVVIEDPELENVLFVGKLRKGQSIEEILNAIKNSSAISTYEIRDKTIVLK